MSPIEGFIASFVDVLVESLIESVVVPLGTRRPRGLVSERRADFELCFARSTQYGVFPRNEEPAATVT